MTTTHIRFATLADAPALYELIERAYRDPATAGRWDSESHLFSGPRTTLYEIRGLLDDPDSRFVVAEADGRIVGCAMIQNALSSASASDVPTDRDAYFGMFAIAAEYRSAGLGKTILAECERRARELWNAPGLMMTVISVRDELIAWYGRRGYLPTGARTPFPFSGETGETRRDFDLIVLRKAF